MASFIYQNLMKLKTNKPIAEVSDEGETRKASSLPPGELHILIDDYGLKVENKAEAEDGMEFLLNGLRTEPQKFLLGLKPCISESFCHP
ncbi:hypothetical protein Pyn_10488 [Prunus yedoensis var. nudiflora]|uniref:Uncharacterized protein n=1 Tax=Prunus yedoensis var. nudiflora TaxID=2094558 RepID=A0A314XWL8_PRUYE|nr:hypothetical protein Pyn_10488 [Prunus yedoensis var. nudiflora]